jgi:hypothetical protein
MNMKCDQCGRLVDDKPCPFCQSTRVRELKPGEEGYVAVPAPAPAQPPPPPPPREKIFEPPRRQSVTAPKPPPPRAERPRTPPPPPKTAPADGEGAVWGTPPTTPRPEPAPQRPAAAPDSKAREIRGLAEFEALLNVEHFSSVIVCGMGKSGKSEIASGFTRANTFFRGRTQTMTLRSMSGQMYSLGGTAPREVWFQPINTGRKLVFLDPSGEFFDRISPTTRQRLNLPDVTPDHFQFVRSAVGKLAAVVVVFDLTRTLDGMSKTPWLDQEIDLDFMLGAIRLLRHDKSPDIENVNISTLIAARLPRLPRLDVPVLVLFSKADMLGELTNEAPLRFARRRLPRLHASLRTHARRFRFDFVNTMRNESKDVDVQVERPCGVLLSMEWLLTDPFRWMPKLPTRFLEGL